MSNKRTINDWVPEVRSLLGRLVDAGFTILSGHNGEEKFKFNEGDLGDFIGNLIACDESRLFVKSPEGRKRWLFLVFGNSPGELVADYLSYTTEREPDQLAIVIDGHYNEWEGKPQPTKDEV